MTTQTVHCKAPTRRQVKQDIKKRLLKNPCSRPAKEKEKRAEERRFMKLFRSIKGAIEYGTTPTMSQESERELDSWRNPSDHEGYRSFFFFDHRRDPLEFEDFILNLPVEKGTHQFDTGPVRSWLDDRRHLVLDSGSLRHSDRPVAISTEEGFRKTCEYYWVDADALIEWAGLGFKRPTKQEEKPTERHSTAEAQQQNRDGNYVPALIAFAIGLVAASMIYWK